MDHCESSYVKKDCFSCAHPSEEPCERSLKNVPRPHSRKLTNSTYPPNEGHTIQTLCLNKSSMDFSTSLEPGSVTSSNSFMGKFVNLTSLTQTQTQALANSFIPDVTERSCEF